MPPLKTWNEQLAATAGTIIGAALESSGYAAQAQVLDQLYPLLLGFAVIATVISSIFCLWKYITTGDFTFVGLKLIAAPIILMLLNYRVMSNGVDWQYTSDERQNVPAEEIIKLPVKEYEVSWVFEKFNQLTSAVVRTLSAVAMDQQVRDQALFMNRQQIMGLLMGSEIASPGLLNLLNEGIQGKCGAWLAAARRVARGNTDAQYQGTPEYNTALFQYNKLYSDKVIKLDSQGSSYKYLSQLLPSMANYQRVDTGGNVVGTGAEAFVTEYCENGSGPPQDLSGQQPGVLESPLSCAQLWCWSAMGLYDEGRAALERSLKATVESNSVYQQMSDAEKAQVISDILLELALKVSPREYDPNTGEEITRVVDPSIVPTVIAGLLLRRELSKDPRASLKSDFGRSSGVRISSYQPNLNLTPEELAELREKSSGYAETVSARAEGLTLALSLPYFQGAILYTLGLTFPFFCVLLIMPGHSRGFFIWFGAWMWAKSWDVGWALIMAVDNVLWDLMPHQAVYEPSATGTHNPITILESAFDGDPTYSLTMYYTILAMLIFSVPSFLGQILIGSLGGMSELLLERLQWTAATQMKSNALQSAELRLKSFTPDEAENASLEMQNRLENGLGLQWDASKRFSGQPVFLIDPPTTPPPPRKKRSKDEKKANESEEVDEGKYLTRFSSDQPTDNT